MEDFDWLISNDFAGSAKPLSTRLTTNRFRASAPHRRSTTVSLEFLNSKLMKGFKKPFINLSPLLTGYFGTIEIYGHRVYDNRGF